MNLKVFFLSTMMGMSLFAASSLDRGAALNVKAGGLLGQKFSFSEFLDSSEGQERLSKLENLGISFRVEDHFELVSGFPLEPLRATQGRGFDPTITHESSGQDYHAKGDRWEKDRLRNWFLKGFAHSLVVQYWEGADYSERTLDYSAKNYRSINTRFPLFPKQFFPKGPGIQGVGFNPDPLIRGHSGIEKWWEAYRGIIPESASFGNEFRSPLFKGKKGIFREFDEVLKLDRPQGHPGFVEEVMADMASYERLCHLGASYQKFKIVEEKSLDSVTMTPGDKRELSEVLDRVEDLLNFWVATSVKYALYHRILDLPVRGSTADAEVEMNFWFRADNPYNLDKLEHELERLMRLKT
jgi:hypothetical protein